MLNDRILFHDAEALLLDKPAGVPVDAPRDGTPSIENALQSLRFGFARAPSIVHRLDRDTSGVLLLARNPRAHRHFAEAFDQRRATKHYLAVVEGVPAAASGTVDMALGKVSTRETGWRIVPDLGGKPARTGWRVLGVAGNRALLLLTPETGRTHQLRAHMASALGLPIVGDRVYGAAGPAMLLHAWQLSVPREGKPPVAGEAVPPPAFDPWRTLIPGSSPAGS